MSAHDEGLQYEVSESWVVEGSGVTGILRCPVGRGPWKWTSARVRSS